MWDDAALLDLLRWLKQRGYRFHAVTPATHTRILARKLRGKPSLRDVFGWNRPFAQADVEPELFALLQRAGLLQACRGHYQSSLRVASLGDDLFLHSPFPTDRPDSVFFGPDTYRYVRFVRLHWPTRNPGSIVDMGAGSGAGGIAAARLAPGGRVTLVDLNPAALRLARINAQAAGVEVELIQAGTLPSGADLVIANPPYMIDPARRVYRDGGDLLGGAVALDWVEQALAKLAPGGTMLLYTGAAFVDGEAPLVAALGQACAKAGAALELEEIDPDVFGEELDQRAYAHVERIAAIGAVIRR